MSDFVIPTLGENLDIISGISNRPTQAEPDNLTPEEFKAKFDEAGNIIKDFINKKLIPAIVAANIPFASTSGNITGETIAAALEELKNNQSEAQLGKITDGTLTLAKMDAEVTGLLMRGEPIVSMLAPAEDADRALTALIGTVWVQENGDGTVKAMHMKISQSDWYCYNFDIVPVERGGTGKAEHGVGDLLYGGERGALETLSAPLDGSFLRMDGKKPKWEKDDAAKTRLGILRQATGSYEGDGGAAGIREIQLTDQDGKEIMPDCIWIYTDGWVPSLYLRGCVCLCQGATEYGTHSGTVVEVKLNESNIVFSKTSGSLKSANFMNENGKAYKWTAFYREKEG